MSRTPSHLCRGVAALSGVAIAITLWHPALQAQRRRDDYTRLSRIDPDTFVTVRTNESISSERTDGRVFTGVVAEDVWDDSSRLAVPAIPEGSRAELIVRTARDGDLILDLDSVFAHGQRYAVDAAPERVEAERGVSNNGAGLIGGGAILGTIIGAIAGGGKGAAIGAAAGAAAGVGLAVHGRSIRVPAGSTVTFRLERGLTIGVADWGFDRDRVHYHRDADRPPPDRPSPDDRPPQDNR